jgi:hypothetical protein
LWLRKHIGIEQRLPALVRGILVALCPGQRG